MLFRSRRSAKRALLAAALCATAVGLVPATAQAAGTTNDAPKVMTRNLYLGADLSPALGALGCPDTPCTLAANQTVWDQVVATDFPARAKKLAKEIDDDDPYVVGLQEVALWRTGPVDFAKNASTVVYDFLPNLLAELSARGNKYKAIVVQQEADIESPAGTPPYFADAADRRLTMRDVILVRTDLPKGRVSFSNPQSGNYANFISLPIPGGVYGGTIDFKRGWTAVDIKIANKPAARFVNTHLESFSSGIRQAQAFELVGGFASGPLLTSIPAILVGDLNSDPAIAYGGNPASSVSDGAAYGITIGAGFVDTGNTLNTFGHDADLLDDPSNVFGERIDHILTRPGTFGLLTTKRVGLDPLNRAPSGAGLLWPSDHAGLIAGF